MAKVPFTKLKCKINTDEIPVQIGEETIAVKQYLPIQEKLNLISDVIVLSHEQDQNYSNPVKAGVFRDLEIVFAYTNISFTDKQKEDPAKLYDCLKSSGVLAKIIENIPHDEYCDVINGINTSLKAVYDYQNSVMGVLENVKADYEDAEYNANNVKELLESSDLATIKEIISKLG